MITNNPTPGSARHRTSLERTLANVDDIRRAIQRGLRAGRITYFTDATRLADYPDDSVLSLVSRHERRLAGALQRKAERLKYSLPLMTYALMHGRLSSEDEMGPLQAHVLPEYSRDAVSLAGLVTIMDEELRPGLLRSMRVMVLFPSERISDELARHAGLETDMDSLHWALGRLLTRLKAHGAESHPVVVNFEEGMPPLHKLQEIHAFERLIEFCRRQDLLPVHWEPDAPVKGAAGLMQTTVTLMDRQTALTLTAGEGLGSVHYLSGFFSTGGADRRGTPDYRVVGMYPVTPELAGRIGRFLGHASTPGDGRGLYLVRYDKRGRPRLGAREESEFQFRLFQRRTRAFAKGVFEPVDNAYVRRRLFEHIQEVRRRYAQSRRYERQARRLTREAWRLRHTDTARAWRTLGAARAYHHFAADELVAARAFERESRDVYRALRYASRGQGPRVIVVRGDQIKIGAGRAEAGPAYVAGTYITGRRYDMAFGSQGIQYNFFETFPELAALLEETLEEDVLLRLRTPEGWRALVWGAERVLPGLAEAGRDEAGRAESRQLVVEEADTLRLALSSGLVVHTTEGLTARAYGLPVLDGQLRTLRPVHRLMDRIAAAAVARTTQSFGLEMTAYVHLTAGNAISELRRLWGLEKTRSVTFRPGVAFHMTQDRMVAYPEVVCQEDPARTGLVGSRAYVPEHATSEIGADDDGDLSGSLGAVDTFVETPHGHVLMKVVPTGRFPMIDAMSFWALPAGTQTPWDVTERDFTAGCRTREELFARARRLQGEYGRLAELGLEDVRVSRRGRRRWRYTTGQLREVINSVCNARARRTRRYLEILRLRAPDDWAERFSADRVVPLTGRFYRIAASNVRALARKKKFEGALTLDGTLRMGRRQRQLNVVGQATRQHEKLAVRHAYYDYLARMAGAGTPAATPAALSYQGKARVFMQRLFQNQLTIEGGLIGRKYDEHVPPSPPLWLGRQDDVYMSEAEARAALSLDYHEHLWRVRRIEARYTDVDGPELALETMTVPTSQGPIAYLLQYVIAGAGTGAEGQGGIYRRIAAAFKAVDVSPVSFAQDIRRRLTGLEVTPELTTEVECALTALELWAPFLEQVQARYQARVAEAAEQHPALLPELIEAAERERRALIAAMKRYLAATGSLLSEEALSIAFHDAVLGAVARASREDGTLRREPSVTPALALVGTRTAEIFPPREASTITQLVHSHARRSVRVYTTDGEIPGPMLGRADGVVLPRADARSFDLVYEDEAAGGAPRALTLRLGDKQELSHIPADAVLTLVKLTPNSGLVDIRVADRRRDAIV